MGVVPMIESGAHLEDSIVSVAIYSSPAYLHICLYNPLANWTQWCNASPKRVLRELDVFTMNKLVQAADAQHRVKVFTERVFAASIVDVERFSRPPVCPTVVTRSVHLLDEDGVQGADSPRTMEFLPIGFAIEIFPTGHVRCECVPRAAAQKYKPDSQVARADLTSPLAHKKVFNNSAFDLRRLSDALRVSAVISDEEWEEHSGTDSDNIDEDNLEHR
eukprot:GEMP01038226.1.p1 GENE.GEMP01038226.1~~GEMP01038226.1.p1  ORF type:complete len:218 (+),score=50.31 GEMP01038226.1:158-811(+)